MTAAIFRPNVEAWRNHDEEQRARRMDAVAAFEAQRAADRDAAERFNLAVAMTCFTAAIVIAALVLR